MSTFWDKFNLLQTQNCYSLLQDTVAKPANIRKQVGGGQEEGRMGSGRASKRETKKEGSGEGKKDRQGF